MQGSLFGYGKTTQAIARLLGAKFGGFKIYDDNFTQAKSDEFGNTLLNPREFKASESVFEIPSPSFPREHELIKAAKNLISEYDFFYDAMPKSVWISGTNGKTTTTQMTQHLLAKFGSQMGGNVGVPLAELDANAKIWVLETSSFTLHYTRTAKPEIYALLPITPDHLSWHGSFESYAADKLSVLARLKEGDVAIVPQIYAQTPCKARVIGYEDEFDLAQKLGIDTGKIDFQTPFLMDAVFALSIEKILLDRTSYDKLNGFVIEANKLEELLDAHGRLWVNDTKATNIDAVLAAFARYKDKKIHLIIGGDDKGVSLKPLFEAMKALDISLYAIGASTDKVLVLADEFGIKAYKCEILPKAVAMIDKNFGVNSNQVALLSPACASLDQFSSYAKRGEVFKQCVKKL